MYEIEPFQPLSQHFNENHERAPWLIEASGVFRSPRGAANSIFLASAILN